MTVRKVFGEAPPLVLFETLKSFGGVGQNGRDLKRVSGDSAYDRFEMKPVRLIEGATVRWDVRNGTV